MSRGERSARWKAGAAALLLVLAGAALGVLLDRAWLRPGPAAAAPLTVDEMVKHLALAPTDESRVRMLLDSVHAEVILAAEQGPAALTEAARAAHARIEAALPEHARVGFREWIDGHHQELMARMHGGGVHGGMHPPGR
jgi:hypothetical protein